ncbi:putative F-box protein At5g55150 [Rutidosis leptorrhynchoides]|uniref:putative F-box protein At5g55150 n=1 Tax=Rutidosis leptorrhynchoides TaxID=125765 RepID=UPI003A99F271
MDSKRVPAAVRSPNHHDSYPNGVPSRFPCLLLADKKEEHVRKKYFPNKKYIRKLLNRFPSLIRAEEKEDDVREVFSLSSKSISKIRLPEASGKICMSSGGWILTVGDDFVTKLINPFTRQIINLPIIYTFPEFASTSKWYIGFRKLVLVDSLSLVVVLWGCSGKLGFCRYEDEKWTAIVNGWDQMFLDIAYHKGRIYSFGCNHQIQACDVLEENPTIVTVTTLPKDLYGEWRNGYFVHKWLGGAYIVGGWEENVLLVVIREGMYDNSEDELCDEIYKTTSFRIFKYDLDSEEWSEVKDLGTKALFVGYSQSFFMEEEESIIKGNCIYFTDDVFELYAVSFKGGGRDMGVYHMSSGTVEPHFEGESRSHLAPPIWLQPPV